MEKKLFSIIILVVAILLVFKYFYCSTDSNDDVDDTLNVNEFVLQNVNDINDTLIYTRIDKMPFLESCKFEIDFKSCSDKKFIKFIYDNIKYQNISDISDTQATIISSFIIEKNGTVSNVNVSKGKDLSNIKEVILSSPSWIPGIQNGLEKRVEVTVPVKVFLN